MAVSTNKQLYEQDFYLWLEQTANQLKNKNFEDLDLENLIEEIEDLGREQKNAVYSLTRQIIIHLLLLQFWSDKREENQRHWRGEIIEFRYQLERKLTGSLQNYLEQELDNIYQKAKRFAENKANLSLPASNPYSLAEILDEDWYPD